jgi:hypothetical protein
MQYTIYWLVIFLPQSNLLVLKANLDIEFTHVNYGELLHMDFAFWNIVSHCGFTAVLAIVDVCSRFIWLICTASKKPLINILQWFIVNLRCEDRTLAHIRFDEDRSLTGSTAFTSFIHDDVDKTLLPRTCRSNDQEPLSC